MRRGKQSNRKLLEIALSSFALGCVATGTAYTFFSDIMRQDKEVALVPHSRPSNVSRQQASALPPQETDDITLHPLAVYGLPTLKEEVLVKEGFILAWDKR